MSFIQPSPMILFMLMVIVTSASSARFCSGSWTESPYSGTCIKVFESSKTWGEARTSCQSFGADLVRILNARMNTLIYDLIKLVRAKYFWLGLHARPNGVFRWLDDSTKANYTHWVTQPPKHHDRPVAAEMRKGQGGKWHHYSQDYQQGYVCEKLAGKL
ncbi:hypothetical protein RRG08_061067 [Elysia crispata]|uniref:C-type lectin domain-containing protein n=1 Tax=Elysia crispata TaxID=231223 RepID=A0AAE0ZSX6_9GAST|nr:hypothetical protein RRG08_061067 [Elysia crispata]